MLRSVLTTVVLGNLLRMLDRSASLDVFQLSHDIVRSLDKVPDVEEATVDVGRSPLRMRFNGRDEFGEAAGDLFTSRRGGESHDGAGIGIRRQSSTEVMMESQYVRGRVLVGLERIEAVKGERGTLQSTMELKIK